MAQLGNNIFISIGSATTPIAGTKANEIQTDVEAIPVSSPNSGQWRENKAGWKEWSFTVGWLVATASAATGTKLANLLDIGTTYTIKVCERNGSTTSVILTGTALCKQAKVTSTWGNLAQGSFQFLGSGPLAPPAE